MAKKVIPIPDLGGVSDVQVVEIVVSAGDNVAVDDILLVLESDKAAMEIPSPYAGTLLALAVKQGDSVVEGDDLATIDVADVVDTASDETAQSASAPVVPAAPTSTDAATELVQTVAVRVPDLGGAEQVEIIEFGATVGAVLAEGDTYMVLESDKASMEVPSPVAGKVAEVCASVGDVISEGALVLRLEVELEAATEGSAPPAVAVAVASAPAVASPMLPPVASAEVPSVAQSVHAGPAVRKIAREFGVSLGQVTASGPKGRILKEDIQAYVKAQLQPSTGAGLVSAAGIPALPEVDFSQFGPVRTEPMSKLQKITAANMQRSWLNVPRVTQFDDADITELEAFRTQLKAEAQSKGLKITPMPFLLKACALALVNNPAFNASLHHDGEQIVYKDYVHIGMAVATPAGLMVPVVRDVDKKSVYQLAAESNQLAQQARDRTLKPQHMQGGCFTISSLGNIGGTGFTPVVNAPEIAILGVSKLSVQPVWDGSQFAPRKMLPLSLAYDHRAVNGADAGKFMTELVASLADIRRLLL